MTGEPEATLAASATISRAPTIGGSVVVAHPIYGRPHRGCCDVLAFFDAAESAEAYLREHSDGAGPPVSIPDAIEAGNAVFGDIFKDT